MHRLYIILLMFFVPVYAEASIIFSDNFNWEENWDSSQAATVLQTHDWGGFSAQNRGGDFEAAYVNELGARGPGKGFIQYWDQTTDYEYAQDIWLSLRSSLIPHPTLQPIVFPDEYFIGYWFKVDPEWDWGGITSYKIIKTNYADGTTWDIVWGHQFLAYCGDSWCSVDGSYWTGDPNCIASISTDDSVREVTGCWSDVNDGQWHSFIWHMNHPARTLSLSIDGIDASQMSPSTLYSDTYAGGIGTERWGIGGNVTNGGGGKDEMWSAFDDFIIATTQDEIESFWSVNGSDTIAPAMPTGLAVI